MSNPVEELLRSKGVSFTPSGQDYLTKCFNPDHNDSNPSFRIDKHSGTAHCFSCGHKLNIFKFYGILTNHVSIKLHKLKEKLRALVEQETGLKPIEMSRPFKGEFRGLSAKTLKEFGAFTTEVDDKLAGRVFFPITDILDKTVAYIGRHQHSDSNPKYLVWPEGVSTPLFPAKLEGMPKAIVLVEGIVDMLNMYEKGARNVVCTFGTTKVMSDVGTKLLPYKVMGVEKVFLLFDGDRAGQEAAARTQPLVEAAGFYCENIPTHEDTDPGSMDDAEAQQIIEYTKYA